VSSGVAVPQPLGHRGATDPVLSVVCSCPLVGVGRWWTAMPTTEIPGRCGPAARSYGSSLREEAKVGLGCIYLQPRAVTAAIGDE